MAAERPLVSATYRLAATVLALAAAAGAFAPPAAAATVGVAEALATERGGGGRALIAAAEAAAVSELFVGLLRRVAAACGMYKDELLVPCLKLLLSAPPALLAAQPPSNAAATCAALSSSAAPLLAQPLALALRLGGQHVPVAEVAVGALERWEKLQPATLRAAMPYFVPLLEPYLAEQYGTGLSFAGAAAAASATPASPSELPPGSRAAKESPTVPASDPSTQLRALQCRVQLWLGRNPPALPLLAAVDLSALAAAAGAGLNVDGAAADGAIVVSAAGCCPPGAAATMGPVG